MTNSLIASVAILGLTCLRSERLAHINRNGLDAETDLYLSEIRTSMDCINAGREFVVTIPEIGDRLAMCRQTAKIPYDIWAGIIRVDVGSDFCGDV
jgi:hypothetical protein